MSWHDTNATAAAACGIAPVHRVGVRRICGEYIPHTDGLTYVCELPRTHTGLHAAPSCDVKQEPPMTSLEFMAKALGYPQPRKEGGK